MEPLTFIILSSRQATKSTSRYNSLPSFPKVIIVSVNKVDLRVDSLSTDPPTLHGFTLSVTVTLTDT